MEVWKRKAAGKPEQRDRRGEGRDGNKGLGRCAVCGRCPGGRLVSLDEVRGQPSEVTLSDKQGPSSLWSEGCHPFGPSMMGNPQTLTPLFPSPSILLIPFIRWRGCLELEDISRLSETAARENWYQARVPEPALLSTPSQGCLILLSYVGEMRVPSCLQRWGQKEKGEQNPRDRNSSGVREPCGGLLPKKDSACSTDCRKGHL